METHALKHHYHHHNHHHHPAPASPAVSHSPTSLSAISGSPAPQTGSRSTAFPLLISSIESGQKQQQQNTSATSLSRAKSSHQAGQNASGLTIQQQLSQFLGTTPAAAAKHKAVPFKGHDSPQLGSLSSSNHSATNGGVKGTPRSVKSAATPLAATGLGRLQATAQPSPQTHGKVIGAEGSSLTPHITPATALPYKKNLLARDSSPHHGINNGRGRNHHHHQQQSPNNVQNCSNGEPTVVQTHCKELPSIPHPVPPFNHVTMERDIPRLRSPPRSLMQQHCVNCPNGESAAGRKLAPTLVGAKASPTVHHHHQHHHHQQHQLGNNGANHTPHNQNVDHGLCAAVTAARGTAGACNGATVTASSLTLATVSRDLDKSAIATGNTSSSQVLSHSLSQAPVAVEEPKPKEFKFFKEKAKGKQAGKAGAAKQPQVCVQNLPAEKKISGAANKAPPPSEPLPEPPVAAGKQAKTASTSKAPSGNNNNRGGKKAEKSRAASAPRESRSASENMAAGPSQSSVIETSNDEEEEDSSTPSGPPRVIDYYECLLEGFAFQVFDNANDLMRSVLEHDRDRKEQLDRELETLNLDLPPDPNEVQLATPTDSVIVVCRDPRTSDEESDVEEDSDADTTCLSSTHSASRSRATANKSNKRTSPAKKKPSKTVMAKRGKKGKAPREVSSDEESADEEQSDEESDEEENDERSKPANRKSIAGRNAQNAVARCNHKHPKGQKACYKCLAVAKKASAGKPIKANEKKTAVAANKKKAAIGRKTKSKVTKGKVCAASGKVKNRGAVAAKGKTRKNLRATASTATSEDESSEHEEADSDDEQSSEEEESDATQADSDGSSASPATARRRGRFGHSLSPSESDSSDEDQEDSDATGPERPHLFDLIKDTRRRAVVHQRHLQDHPTATVTTSRTKTNRQSSLAVTDLGASTSASGPPGTTSNADSETGGKKKTKVSGKMANTAKRTAASGRTANNNTNKKASAKQTKQTTAKKGKGVTEESGEEDSVGEESDASDEEEEETEVIPAKARKGVKRNLRSTATAKANQKKTPPAKKQVKKTPKKRKKPESEESEEESDSDEDENSTEEEEDQNTTEEENEDEEMDEESSEEDSDEEGAKKGKGKAKSAASGKKAPAKKKPARQGKAKPCAKVSKTLKTAKGKKPEKCSSKCNMKSEDETEASESDNAANDNEKEENLKTTTCNATLISSDLEKCKPPPPDKDVYTFELSPASEVAPTTRLVLSSENRARHENTSTRADESAVENPVAATCSVTNTPHGAPPNGLSFEPLRPDTYSHYDSSAFGPNASLSSLSQLSQSIGGGTGPIVLNHQNGPINRYPVPIKEEPREEAYRTMGKPSASKQTPPPAMAGDQLAASHNLGANLLKNGHQHPNRQWSTASVSSLMSSSSSSSNSPVAHPPFAHQIPIPASPASLASYFSPSHLPPTYSSQGQPDLMRRDLNSRMMDQNHVLNGGPGGLSIAPPAGSVPVPPPTHFSHHPSGVAPSPLIPSSQTSVPPPSSLPPATSYLPPSTAVSVGGQVAHHAHSHAMQASSNSSSKSSVVPFNNHFTKPITVSVVTPSTAARLTSSPFTFASTAAQIRDKKSCRHVKIALDIFNNSRFPRSSFNASENNTPSSQAPSHHKSSSSSKSSKSHSHSSLSSKSTTELNPLVQSSISKASTSSTSSKHSSSALPPVPTSVDSYAAAVASIGQSNNNSQPRSQSASIPSQYPRYPTPGPLAPPSISAPPSLSTSLFPPTTSIGDSWARPPPPIPGAPSLYRNQYTNLPDFYSQQATASSMMAAWASGIRPPLDLLASSANTELTNQVPKHSTSHSHKRKHEEIESSSKERTSSTNRTPTVPIPYQNGDMRHEHSNKKHHSSSKHSSKSSGSHITENGGERVNRVKTEPTTSSLSTANPFLSNPSLPSTPMMPPMGFNGAHPAAAGFPSAEQQRYLELLQLQASSGLSGTSYPNAPSTSFMTNNNATDLSSKPLWPFGLGTPSPSFPSHLGASPFAQDLALKSLHDISQRPGMVQQDSQSLFARYSMLNASGGGASILDKLNKEEIEKFHQNQARNNANNFSASRTESSRPPSSGRSSNSMSNSSRSHLSVAPPPPAMPQTIQPPTLCPTPGPIPFSPLNYMNLNPLASASYFQQSLGSLYSGHPSLMNGSADPTKMSSMGSTLGTSSEHVPHLGHFPAPFPGFAAAGLNPLLAQANPLSFLNAKSSAAAAINFNSTR